VDAGCKVDCQVGFCRGGHDVVRFRFDGQIEDVGGLGRCRGIGDFRVENVVKEAFVCWIGLES